MGGEAAKIKATAGAGQGVYVLLLEHDGPLVVGALGELHFKGLYLYVGSALGPAGFTRLARHWQHYRQRSSTRRWHVDYLLGAGRWRGAYCQEAGPGAECCLAQALARELPVVPGFGSSDCRCCGHLVHAPNARQAQRLLVGLGLAPWRVARAARTPAPPPPAFRAGCARQTRRG